MFEKVKISYLCRIAEESSSFQLIDNSKQDETYDVISSFETRMLDKLYTKRTHKHI